MELLGVQLTQIDWRAWLEGARDFALPRFLQSGGLLLAVGVLFWSARWLLGRAERWLARTRTKLDEMMVRLTRRVALLSIVFWAIWRLAHIWELSGTSQFSVALWIVALTLPIGAFVADVLGVLEERVLRRMRIRLDETSLPLLNNIVRFLVVAAGVLVALEYLGIKTTPVLAGAGVVGLAVSLAAKDTLSNVIAGLLLILDRPFRVGDRIELWSSPKESGTWGDVIEIGLRATKIRNPDNVVIIVPNNEIMRRDIINYTTSGPHIRLRVPIGIAYDADVDLAKRLVLEVAKEVRGVKGEPAPAVIVRGFGESAVNLELRVWIDDARERRAIADEITERVKKAFEEGGVEIPYPKRDLYVRTAPDSKDGGVGGRATGLPGIGSPGPGAEPGAEAGPGRGAELEAEVARGRRDAGRGEGGEGEG